MSHDGPPSPNETAKAVEFEGMRVAYQDVGSGEPLLMLHGSGPGASTAGNWRLVLPALAERFHVIAPDLIGFGLSDRKTVEPFFDMDLWLSQARAMLDLFGVEAERGVNVIAHSLSGPLALRLAGLDRRVRRVLTTGSLGVRYEPNAAMRRIWTFPADREAIREAGRVLVYDPSVIDDAYVEGRVAVLHDGLYGDYFSAMFAGDKQRYIDAAVLSPAEIAAICCPVLLVHGRDDQPVPLAQAALPLAAEIDHADLMILARCGHSPALEHPETFVAIADAFFRLGTTSFGDS